MASGLHCRPAPDQDRGELMGWALIAALLIGVCVSLSRLAIAIRREHARFVRDRGRQIGEILDVHESEFPFAYALESIGEMVPFEVPGDLRLVTESGSPRGLTVTQLRGLRLGGAGTAAGATIIMSLLIAFAPQILVFALLAAAAGFFAPTPWLRGLAKQRGDRARGELPEALDLISVMMYGGLSFERGLEEASSAFRVLGSDFRRLIQDLSLGATRLEALERFEQRLPGPETRLFVSSVRQATRMGTPLSSVLQGLADDVRRQRVELAKQKGAKAATLMAFPMAFLILPALLLLVGGPVFLRQM